MPRFMMSPFCKLLVCVALLFANLPRLRAASDGFDGEGKILPLITTADAGRRTQGDRT